MLGTARDWDVFATETLPPLAAGFAGDATTASGLARMRRRLAPCRRAARQTAQQAVAAPSFTRLLLAAGALAATARLGVPVAADRSDPLSQPARAFAAELLARRHRKLAQRGAALAHATPEERHAVRIAAKKMRYAAEFFAPLYGGKRARAYVGALARLQDALGHLNDAATAARLAAGLAGTTDAATSGAVRGWVTAQAAALAPELGAAWSKFAVAPRFWTRD